MLLSKQKRNNYETCWGGGFVIIGGRLVLLGHSFLLKTLPISDC